MQRRVQATRTPSPVGVGRRSPAHSPVPSAQGRPAVRYLQVVSHLARCPLKTTAHWEKAQPATDPPGPPPGHELPPGAGTAAHPEQARPQGPPRLLEPRGAAGATAQGSFGRASLWARSRCPSSPWLWSWEWGPSQALLSSPDTAGSVGAQGTARTGRRDVRRAWHGHAPTARIRTVSAAASGRRVQRTPEPPQPSPRCGLTVRPTAHSQGGAPRAPQTDVLRTSPPRQGRRRKGDRAGHGCVTGEPLQSAGCWPSIRKRFRSASTRLGPGDDAAACPLRGQGFPLGFRPGWEASAGGSSHSLLWELSAHAVTPGAARRSRQRPQGLNGPGGWCPQDLPAARHSGCAHVGPRPPHCALLRRRPHPAPPSREQAGGPKEPDGTPSPADCGELPMEPPEQGRSSTERTNDEDRRCPPGPGAASASQTRGGARENRSREEKAPTETGQTRRANRCSGRAGQRGLWAGPGLSPPRTCGRSGRSGARRR